MSTPLSLFHYDPVAKLLSADASDLGPNCLIQPFNDSIDVGIAVVSHITGLEATFVENACKLDGEGDVEYWDFIPTDESLRRNKRLAGMTIRVYND